MEVVERGQFLGFVQKMIVGCDVDNWSMRYASRLC